MKAFSKVGREEGQLEAVWKMIDENSGETDDVEVGFEEAGIIPVEGLLIRGKGGGKKPGRDEFSFEGSLGIFEEQKKTKTNLTRRQTDRSIFDHLDRFEVKITDLLCEDAGETSEGGIRLDVDDDLSYRHVELSKNSFCGEEGTDEREEVMS